MTLKNIVFFYLGCSINLNFPMMDSIGFENISENHVESFNVSFNKVEYAVLVLTAYNNIQQRHAIRVTWGRISSTFVDENDTQLYNWNTSTLYLNPESVKVFFVIGTLGLDPKKLIDLNEENKINNDLLLLGGFRDTYRNLSEKLLHSIKWLNDNLRRLKYLIKCDDDSFVRTDLILRDIIAFAPQMDSPIIAKYVSYKKNHHQIKGLYWGYFYGNAVIHKDGKYIEENWFMCNGYLPYASGGGYVVSAGIINYIAENVAILSLYNIEDVTMGVWTAALKGINRVHDIRFDTDSSGCQNNMFIRHRVTIEDMFKMYQTWVDSSGQKHCTVQKGDRNRYMYNWNVLPKNCCA